MVEASDLKFMLSGSTKLWVALPPHKVKAPQFVESTTTHKFGVVQEPIHKYNILNNVVKAHYELTVPNPEQYDWKCSIDKLKKMKRHNIDKHTVVQQLKKHPLRTPPELILLYPLIWILNKLEKWSIED